MNTPGIYPTTIAHISDLHLSKRFHPENIARAERLLNRVLSKKVDHLVITGDITANGEKEEFALARTLLDRYGLLRPERLSLVIGNHDLFGGVHHAEDIFRFPARLARTKYHARVTRFRKYFTEAFDGCVFGSGEHSFPFAKLVGNVALVGMNSVAEHSRLRNPFGSNGVVSDGQRNRVKKILASTTLQGFQKVILIHHHFNPQREVFEGTLQGVWRAIERETMKLRGRKKLIRLFARGKVGLVLHGHVHENTSYELAGVRFLNTGGSVIGSDPEQVSAHFLRFTPSGIHVELDVLAMRAPEVSSNQLELYASDAA